MVGVVAPATRHNEELEASSPRAFNGDRSPLAPEKRRRHISANRKLRTRGGSSEPESDRPPFWDEPTGSWQYVFHDPETMKGAIVDLVWKLDPSSSSTSTQSAE